jgi:hypothetical protein
MANAGNYGWGGAGGSTGFTVSNAVVTFGSGSGQIATGGTYTVVVGAGGAQVSASGQSAGTTYPGNPGNNSSIAFSGGPTFTAYAAGASWGPASGGSGGAFGAGGNASSGGSGNAGLGLGVSGVGTQKSGNNSSLPAAGPLAAGIEWVPAGAAGWRPGRAAAAQTAAAAPPIHSTVEVPAVARPAALLTQPRARPAQHLPLSQDNRVLAAAADIRTASLPERDVQVLFPAAAQAPRTAVIPLDRVAPAARDWSRLHSSGDGDGDGILHRYHPAADRPAG